MVAISGLNNKSIFANQFLHKTGCYKKVMQQINEGRNYKLEPAPQSLGQFGHHGTDSFMRGTKVEYFNLYISLLNSLQTENEIVLRGLMESFKRKRTEILKIKAL